MLLQRLVYPTTLKDKSPYKSMHPGILLILILHLEIVVLHFLLFVTHTDLYSIKCAFTNTGECYCCCIHTLIMLTAVPTRLIIRKWQCHDGVRADCYYKAQLLLSKR